MRLLRPQLLAFVSAFTMSGCGTVANFASLKPKVYGGIEQDLKFFTHGLPGGIGAGGNAPAKVLFIVGLVTIAGTELCCSALGDTVTLPFTKVLDDEWRLKEAEKPPPEPHRPAMAYGVNGPYLWEATEGPKVSGGERPSMEVESPPPAPIYQPARNIDDRQPSKEVESLSPESIPPPSRLLIEWSQFWRVGPVWPNEGGEPPSP